MSALRTPLPLFMCFLNVLECSCWITRFEHENHAELWSEKPQSKHVLAPDFNKTGMSFPWQDDLWGFMEWSYQWFPHSEDMSSEHCRWCLVQDFIDRANEHPSDQFQDDWHGLRVSLMNKGLPKHVVIEKKPDNEAKVQDSFCGKCNNMMWLKLVKTPTEEESLRYIKVH